nr:putative ribonuclease H-like domain-containing protein [Tanacetum cinerariifolium]
MLSNRGHSIFKTLKEHFEGIKKALIKEDKDMKEIFKELEVEVDQNVVYRKCDEIERKNLLIANENLIVDGLSKEVFYTVTNYVLIVSRFSEIHNAYTVVQARCLELKVEISQLKHKIQKDDHSEMIKCISNLEMLIVVPFHNLEIDDSDDPPFGVYIESRFPVNIEPVELLMFPPPVRNSPKGFLLTNWTPIDIGDPSYQTLHSRLFLNAGRADRPLVFGLGLLKTYDRESLTAQEFHEKVHQDSQTRNDHFGAMIGYRDYVIGDSVISKVYYVEGLRRNLFSVGKICDSNLEVSFRKHSCYVRNEDGVELLKGKSKKYIHKPKSENTIMELLHALHMDFARDLKDIDLRFIEFIASDSCLRYYSRWEVILNGDSSPPTRIVDGAIQIIAPTTVEQRMLSFLWKLLKRGLEIYEAEVKSSSLSSQNTQNIAFVSSNNTDSTNESVNVVPSVFVVSSKATVSTLLNVDSLDLKWQMAMLTMRARRFLKRTGRNLGSNGTDTIRFNMSKVECCNCHRRGYFAREYRSSRITGTKKLLKDLSQQSLVFDCEELHCHESDNSVPKNPKNNRYKIGEGYHAFPPPYIRTFMPHKSDLVFNDAPTASESVANVLNVESSINKPSKDMSKTLRPDAPIVVDWISDSEDETEIKPVPTAVPQSTMKRPRPIKHVVNKAHSTIKRPINHRPATKNSNFHKKDTCVKGNKVNVVQGTNGNAKKASANWVWKQNGNPQQALKDKGVIDSGCLRHMTRNISFLSDFKEINRGYVALGGNPKGGKISGKGKIKTRKLDFDDVYFVKELKFNLFSVSQMVLVTKPQYKTPYELLLGRSPSIGFMRPFGCPVTTLNTLDPLGKFDGKADEGFLVGYSINSKEFRVFNSRTKIVQETLNINFLKNKPNVAGIRPKWLFDIDTLTKVNVVNAPINAVGPNSTNSTNSFNTASPSVNVVSPNFGIDRKSSFVDTFKYPDDPNMPELEDIVYSDDEENIGAEADFFNLETNIHVSPIPTTRVHKDHPVNQIIGDLNSTPQTRSMAGVVKEQGGLHQINDEDFHTFLPMGKRAIGLKWGFRNKKDERGIAIRTKARLMDVKSAFLFRAIEEEVYVCQPLGFEDLDYPDKVYNVVKALYGLH